MKTIKGDEGTFLQGFSGSTIFWLVLRTTNFLGDVAQPVKLLPCR